MRDSLTEIVSCREFARHQEFLAYESDIRTALASQQLHGWFTVAGAQELNDTLDKGVRSSVCMRQGGDRSQVRRIILQSHFIRDVFGCLMRVDLP